MLNTQWRFSLANDSPSDHSVRTYRKTARHLLRRNRHHHPVNLTTRLAQTHQRRRSRFQTARPYDAADHVFNIAINLLVGGTCLEHLDLRQNDQADLYAPEAKRIPDQTTAGDFADDSIE